MLSQVTAKEPELLLEPIAEIGGRSWQKFVRGQYHDTREAPPLPTPDGTTDRILKALQMRRTNLKQRCEERNAYVLSKMQPHWQSIKALRMRCGWSEDATRRVMRRLVKAGVVEHQGSHNRFSSVQYRPVTSGVSPRAGT